MATTIFNILTPFGFLALQSEDVAATAPVVSEARVEFPDVGIFAAQLVVEIGTPASVGDELLLTVNAHNIRIPNQAGSYTLLLNNVFPTGTIPEAIDLRLQPLDGSLVGDAVYYTAYEEAFAVANPPVLTAPVLDVGAALTYTAPTYSNGAPDALVMTLQRDQGTATWIDVGASGSHAVIPNNVGDNLRIKAVVTHPDGVTETTSYSAAVGPVVAVVVSTPAKLAAANMAFLTPFYRPTGQTTWRTARLRLTGLSAQHLDTTLSEYRWTGSTSPTDANSEACTRVSSTDLEMTMDDPLKRLTSSSGTNLDAAGAKLDYSVVKASDSFASRYRFQVRLRATTGSAWSDWSPVSDALTIAELDTPVVDTAAPDHRPLLFRLPGELDAAANMPTRFADGLVGGEGLQWMHAHSRGVNNPNVIYAVQDMGGMRKSEDGGNTWFSPPSAGLGAFYSWDVQCDPTDANFVFYAGAYAWSPPDEDQDGIWLSTNGAKSFTRVLNIPQLGAASTFRYDHDTFCRYPIATGLPTAARWGFVGNTTTAAGNSTLSSIYVYASTGGTTWTLKNTLSAATYGKCSQLCQHPTTENTKYLICAKGIFRTTTWGNTTPTWAQVWASDFPASSLPTRLWIDPADADTMIVSASGGANKGVWYTTNGGDDWTQGLASYAAVNVAVGAADTSGDRWVYVNSARNTVANGSTTMRVRKWTGAAFSATTWKTPTFNQPAVIPANYTGPYKTQTGQGNTDYGGFCAAFPHPTDPAECLQYGYHYYWKTDDGGTTFDASNSFNAGLNVVNFVFDPAQWDRLHVSCADVCYLRFDNGMKEVTRSYNITDAQRQAMGVGTRSASGICVIPNSASDASKRGRIILAVGSAHAGGLFYKDEDGDTYPSDAGFVSLDNNTDNRRQFAVDPDDPARVYMGPEKSDAYGASKSSLGRDFAGLGINRNNLLGYTSGSSGSVAYSTNRGVAWTNIVTGIYLPDGATGKPFVYLDPTNDDRFFTVESGGTNVWDLACWQKIDGTWTKRSIGVRGMYTSAAKRAPKFYVQSVAVDALDPRYLYCSIRGSGPRWLFRGLWNSTFTSVTWTDITRNLPTCNLVGEMRVHPRTGELFVPTVNGVYVVARPTFASDGVTAYTTEHTVSGTIWSGLPIPPDNGWRTLTDLL